MRGALLLALAALAAPAQAEPAGPVFPPAEIAGWTPRAFEGETRYGLGEIGGGPAVRAVCDASASGLFLERRIDLTETPVIEWRWRVERPIPAAPDETAKGGDDFAARIYAVRRGLLPWQSRAVNYVWAARQPEGASWANPYLSQNAMLAVGSGAAEGWQTHRRNLRDDFRRLHGEEVDAIDGLAVMTDCDDTGATAEAWYGEIRFLPE